MNKFVLLALAAVLLAVFVAGTDGAVNDTSSTPTPDEDRVEDTCGCGTCVDGKLFCKNPSTNLIGCCNRRSEVCCRSSGQGACCSKR